MPIDNKKKSRSIILHVYFLFSSSSDDLSELSQTINLDTPRGFAMHWARNLHRYSRDSDSIELVSQRFAIWRDNHLFWIKVFFTYGILRCPNWSFLGSNFKTNGFCEEADNFSLFRNASHRNMDCHAQRRSKVPQLAGTGENIVLYPARIW